MPAVLPTPTPTAGLSPVRAHIDERAIVDNIARLRECAEPAEVMPVLKADAYGHGLDAVLPAVLQAGVVRIGTATAAEGIDLAHRLAQLSRTGHPADVRVLCWLIEIGADFRALGACGVEAALGAVEQLPHLAAAAAELAREGQRLNIHLKVDSGLGRGGLTPAQLDTMLTGLAELPADCAAGLAIVGAMTHLAVADEPHHPFTAEQLTRFDRAVTRIRGFLAAHPELGSSADLLVHAANSPAALTLGAGPDLGARAVRTGLAVYGLSPFADRSPAELGLRPAMTLTSTVLAVKDVPAGSHASYGLTYTCAADTRFALVAGGYADGLPRAASNRAEVLIGTRRFRQVGRIAMDQIVLDIGRDSDVRPGDEVILFGPGDRGEPTADDWARWAGTINYEIVTRIGPRVPRLRAADEREEDR